jgi:alkylation response protein AidB-like acyl-CoA dehydrogenase
MLSDVTFPISGVSAFLRLPFVRNGDNCVNYDFSEAEFLLVVEVERRIRNILPADSPSNGPLDDRVARSALKSLADTAYLRLGLEPNTGLNGLVSLTAAMEVLADLNPGLYLTVESSTRVCGRVLSRWGTEEQRRRWLTPFLEGERIGAVGLSEASLNVENDPLTTVGIVDGDHVVVSGTKQMVVNGPTADVVAVTGTLDGRTVFFLIDPAGPGVVRGPRLETAGYEDAAFGALRFDHCRVASRDIVDPGQPGRTVLETVRLWENQVLVGASLGLMKTGFDTARHFAKTHRSGGKPVIAYQQVGFKLAEMLTLYQTAQLLAYRAAWAADHDPKEAPGLGWCAKVFATEAAEQVTGAALQILAAEGFVHGSRAARAWRCAKYGQIAGTSTEIARVKIGDEALGVGKDKAG